jgi:hypothetical protein
MNELLKNSENRQSTEKKLNMVLQAFKNVDKKGLDPIPLAIEFLIF